jgi:hypothetical protein
MLFVSAGWVRWIASAGGLHSRILGHGQKVSDVSQVDHFPDIT